MIPENYVIKLTVQLWNSRRHMAVLPLELRANNRLSIIKRFLNSRVVRWRAPSDPQCICTDFHSWPVWVFHSAAQVHFDNRTWSNKPDWFAPVSSIEWAMDWRIRHCLPPMWRRSVSPRPNQLSHRLILTMTGRRGSLRLKKPASVCRFLSCGTRSGMRSWWGRRSGWRTAATRTAAVWSFCASPARSYRSVWIENDHKMRWIETWSPHWLIEIIIQLK